jgi:ADP-ribose pyrophosphatase YjhB (NUDIX family)
MNPAVGPLIRCVGAIVHDAGGRLLLIRRATEPGRGRWSIPGGRVQPGESDADAIRREVREETGLVIEVGPLLGSVRRAAPGGAVFDIHDYSAQVIAGRLLAGDDASAARWVTAAEYSQLAVVDGLTEALREWSAMPRRDEP